MEGIAIEGLVRLLERSPVIAAVRDEQTLECAVSSPVRVVFMLGGDMFSLPNLAKRARAAGKAVFVHMDLLEGISRDAAGVRLVSRLAQPDGILSTRPPIVRAATEEGLRTVLRIFMVDSSSYETGERMIKTSAPDMIEVMPGLVWRAITRLRGRISQPVIAGGMLADLQDVRAAMAAGALAVSTSNETLWQHRSQTGP